MTVVALITDFGLRDPYVASMKGVLVSLCRAGILDLTHELAPFDVHEAAFFLRSAAPAFVSRGQEKIIFVIVVDPEVGTDRSIIVASRRKQLFVAPDNGVLSLLLDEESQVRSVINSPFFFLHGSTTFHGRDRFAPLAAALARGTPIDRFGDALSFRNIRRLAYEEPSYGKTSAGGTVIRIDRFGNLITDLEWRRVEGGARPKLRIGGVTVEKFVSTYQQADSGPFILVGSDGTLEVSLREGSAAELLGVQRLAQVTLTWE